MLVLKFVGTKVDQQTIIDVCGAQIIDQLRFMFCNKCRHCLQFKYQTTFDNYVSLIIPNTNPTVVYGDWNFFHGRQSALF